MPKILIIKPTALGDVAQASLVAPGIKDVLPDAHLAWIVDEDFVDVLRLCPAVDEVIAFPRRRWREKFPIAEMWRWFAELQGKQFDVVVDLQGLARSGLMTWVSRAPRRIGFASSRELARLAYSEVVKDDAAHAVDRYRQAVEHMLGEGLPQHHYLRAPERHPKLTTGSYTALHPYSQWDTKLWPWQRYSQLAEALPEETFVMVGRGQPFPVTAKNIVDLRNRTSLAELLSVLAHARAVVSTDSGPAHLAAALRRPVITLFGASDPKKTAPRPSVGKNLTSSVPCHPCIRRICQNKARMQCMFEIEVEQVVEALKALL